MCVNADGYCFTNENICYDTAYLGSITSRQGDQYYAIISQNIVDMSVFSSESLAPLVSNDQRSPFSSESKSS